jgi:hypothetical protein
MYIHKTFHNTPENQNISYYKKELKALSSINLRRSSKFNILAVIGALKCMENCTFSTNMSIYVASEYGSISSVKKVLEQVSRNELVMPFDFLNINTNNVSFYVSQALESTGKNMVVTSEYFSFEKALELAMFELETKEVEDVLIGRVDESLQDIHDFNQYLTPYTQTNSYDISSWIYLNNKSQNALAQIEYIQTIHGINHLKKILKSLEIEHINLTPYTKEHAPHSLFNHLKECSFSYYSNFIELLTHSSHHIVHISMDQNQNIILLKLAH